MDDGKRVFVLPAHTLFVKSDSCDGGGCGDLLYFLAR